MLSNTTIAALMASLDVNIVVIALPTIGRDLHASTLDLLWVLLGYNIVISSLVVNFGRLADMYGRVKLYNFGFALFTVSSALCSLSQTGAELIAFRMIQGVGGAFLMSNSAAILTDTFPANEMGKALGINRVTQIVGTTVGLVIGGFLVTFGGWQAIFWINVPIGGFATIWSHYKLKELGVIVHGQKLDIPGNVTFAAGFVTILAAVSLFALGSLPFSELVVLVGAGAGVLAVFVLIERRAKDPMLTLSLFKSRPYSGGTFASFINSLARGCTLLVMTAYLQGPTMNLSAFAASVYLLPNSISSTVWGPISGYLSDRGYTRVWTTAGQLATFVGFIMLTQIGTTSTFLQFIIPIIFIGSGQGIFGSPNRASVMNSLPPEHRGVGSAVNTTMVNVGNTFSRTFAFLIMSLVIPGAILQNLFAGTAVATDPTFDASFVASVHLVYIINAGLILIAIIPSILRGPTVVVGGRKHRSTDEDEAEAQRQLRQQQATQQNQAEDGDAKKLGADPHDPLPQNDPGQE